MHALDPDVLMMMSGSMKEVPMGKVSLKTLEGSCCPLSLLKMLQYVTLGLRRRFTSRPGNIRSPTSGIALTISSSRKCIGEGF